MKELLPVREENNFKPSPQNRILLPLGRSFQNFPRAPPSFLFGRPPDRVSDASFVVLEHYCSCEK